MSQGWIGVDLDGTLAYYDGWNGPMHIGPPVPLMLARVKEWRERGIKVKIVTARAGLVKLDNEPNSENALAIHYIEQWCMIHIGQVLEVTDKKDFAMIELWDDRCVRVEENTGVIK